MKKLLFLLSIIFLFSCGKETVKYLLTTSSLPADTGTVIPETREYNDGDTVKVTFENNNQTMKLPFDSDIIQTWTK